MQGKQVSFSHLTAFFSNWLIRIPHRFIVRDFIYSEDEIAKQQRDFEIAATTEKELWVRAASYNGFNKISYTDPFIFSKDRAPSTFSHKLFWILPNPCPPQSHPPLRRKRTPIWSTLRIHRYDSEGKEQHNLLFPKSIMNSTLHSQRQSPLEKRFRLSKLNLHTSVLNQTLLNRVKTLRKVLGGIFWGSIRLCLIRSFSILFCMKSLGLLLSFAV